MKEKAVVEYHPMIRDFPDGERPRERLRNRGAGSLTNPELLAILLRVGAPAENVVRMAERLLNTYGGFSGLARADFSNLCAERGMGPAKTAQLKASLEIGKRLLAEEPEQRLAIHGPDDVSRLLQLEMGHLEQEHVKVILLDTKNRVQGMPTVHQGSLNTSLVRVGEVFREPIRKNCAAIILVHNHPSGDPTPSQEDIRLTEEVAQAGKLLDIELLDHLVIGQQRYTSLKRLGLGFK